MLLAASGGKELFAKTRARYFEEAKDTFLSSVFRHIVVKDFDRLGSEMPLAQWKETLAYSLSFTEDCGKEQALALGEALLKENDVTSALLCFILAMKFEMVLKLWSDRLKEDLKKASAQSKGMLLHRAFEKVIVFKTICKSYDTSPLFDEFML